MTNSVREKTLKEGEIVPITFDYVFTNIFNNPENVIILENFLACYLEVPIEKLRGKIEILNRDLIIKHKKEAKKQIDLLVDIEGEKINIELQNQMSDGIMNRNVVFACRVHAGQLKVGDEKYSNIERTLQINLTRKTNEVLKESYYLKNEKGEILTEKLQIDLVDMEIAKEVCYTKEEEKLARWCKVLLARTEEEFKKALGNDLMEEEAKELLADKVEEYSRDEEVVEMYSKYTREELERQSILEEGLEKATKEGLKRGIEQGMEQGIEQGIKQGIEQGIERGKRENQLGIAKKMLSEKIDIEMISKVTELSIEEIEKIK